MKRRRSWFRHLLQRIAAWISRLWGQGNRHAGERGIEQSGVAQPSSIEGFKGVSPQGGGDSKERAGIQNAEVDASNTNQINQSVEGDQNIVIGVIEKDAKVKIEKTIMPPPKPGEPMFFGVPYQRNRYFTGREDILIRLHQQLTQTTTVAISQVQAISGLGGIGKTQTAVEYAYRYFHDEDFYSHVFWVKADTSANLATDFAKLAVQLALPQANGTEEEKIPAVRSWLANHDLTAAGV